MRVLLTGASGMLGSSIMPTLAKHFEVIPVTHSKPGKYQVDLGDHDAVLELLKEVKPLVIINCAALTNVDLCQENPMQAFWHNALSAKNLSQWPFAYMIHVSTDGVFDGALGDYVEDSAPNPINRYGDSKWCAEMMVLHLNKNSLILRLNLFDRLGKWVVDTARDKCKVGLFEDSYFNPMLASEVGPVLLKLLELHPTGILHVAPEQTMSKLKFGQFLLDTVGLRPEIERISVETLKTPRPKNTTLNTDRLKQLGITIPSLYDMITRSQGGKCCDLHYC